MAPFAALLWVFLITAAPHGSLARTPKRVRMPTDHMQESGSRIARGFTGAVSGEDSRCSEIGRDIMAEMGGNAVDATVAVALCSGVVNPMASGIGGGAFLLFLPTNATSPLAFDFREVAPGAASENMYAGNEELKLRGALSVAVPGELAGLHLLWQQYGTLPWNDLFEPAIQLAANGFVVRPYLAAAIETAGSSILADEGLSEVFAPNGTLLGAGDLCVWTSLAKSLASIAEEGPAAFYNGSIGQNFVNDVQDAGGILTMDDLTQYAVKIRDPTVVNVEGLSVFGMPPPSSAGACIALVLNILAAYPDPFQAVEGPLGLHRMVEAIKHAFAIRMNLSDPDFVNVTKVVSTMLNATYAAELQSLINDNKTYPSPYYGGSWSQLNDHGTCHFNIVDGDRNVIAMTSTVNYPFGAKMLSKSTGIVMNNEMDDFSIPTNSSGSTPPAPANFIQPYKRPLSSMAPTIVMKNRQFLGALGGSGGTKIITATLQVFLNRFWKSYQPLDAVSSPRLHHQLFPDVLQYEDWTTAIGDLIEEPLTVVEYLESKGHNMTSKKGGITELLIQDLSDPLDARSVHSWWRIMRGIEPVRGLLTAVSDLRKDGSPSAY
ncbi:hypothetical protein GOP47_0018954 [Adiantum capillus-veneris]|uniref:Glutathione hydrolase n=1 Tax=Adiantum capillus-veneris TaxID=13818 RepID=A0A9D4UEH8_ADICA|nr:hypothetical protein GOP47_0018954 [Adiantum capillus-veneris]